MSVFAKRGEFVRYRLLWDRRFNPQATACDQSSSMGMRVMMRSDTQSPSTSISSPVRIVEVAMPSPQTQGMRYWRLTIDACVSVPPLSQTQAAIFAKAGVQLGEVASHTRRRPFNAYAVNVVVDTVLGAR